MCVERERESLSLPLGFLGWKNKKTRKRGGKTSKGEEEKKRKRQTAHENGLFSPFHHPLAGSDAEARHISQVSE